MVFYFILNFVGYKKYKNASGRDDRRRFVYRVISSNQIRYYDDVIELFNPLGVEIRHLQPVGFTADADVVQLDEYF